jgi:hypothetical protein
MKRNATAAGAKHEYATALPMADHKKVKGLIGDAKNLTRKHGADEHVG